MYHTPAPQCRLNVVPVSTPQDATLRVGFLPYDRALLDRLREEHRGVHYLKWDRVRDRIACVSLNGNDPLGSTLETLKCRENPWLTAPLVLEALLRFFHAKGRRVLGHKPVQVVSRRADDDLLRALGAEGLTSAPWLERRISYLFDTRTVYPSPDRAQIGLACDVRLINLVGAPVSELLLRGVDVHGLYVQERVPGSDHRLSQKVRLLGRVARVDGVGDDARLHFDDHAAARPGSMARDVYLEPRQETVDACVRAIAGHRADAVLRKSAQAAGELRHGSVLCGRVDGVFAELRKYDLELVPGVPITMGPVLREGEGEWYPPWVQLRKPTLYFYGREPEPDTWNQRGLDRCGPFDRATFTPKVLRVALVCQAVHQETVEEWMAHFLHGLPSSATGRGTPPYAKGFLQRFDLQEVRTKTFLAPGRDAGAYALAAAEALDQAAGRDQAWDLVIVQTEDAFHALPAHDNPYATSRSTFLKRGVPVQAVTIEVMRKAPPSRGYVMNNLSLATYAKLGGVPWLLEAKPTVARELVLGLGSHAARDSRFSDHERLVGITTIFSADGRYLLETRSQAVPYDEYATALLDAVERGVRTIRSEQDWKASDSIRLVFHSFKPFRDEEVRAIERVVRSLGHSAAQFACVHFAESHAYRLFDVKQDGVRALPRGTKGVWVPPRGLCLHLNPSEALVCFSGPNEVKKPGDGVPQPVLMKLHPLSTFKDLTTLARQAFDFSCHSWQTFQPVRLPISVLYSDMIAQQMRLLGKVPGWDPDAIHLGPVGYRPWFL